MKWKHFARGQREAHKYDPSSFAIIGAIRKIPAYFVHVTYCSIIAKVMDRIFVLHADHEQNASTSTVRLTGSTGANPYACIAAGIAALWGPSHGGANEAVLKMLDEIGDVSNLDNFIARVKDKNDSTKLMGFGHRVYKNFDPRAKVMKQTCDEVLSTLVLTIHN